MDNNNNYKIVKPLLSGHPWGNGKKWPFNRGWPLNRGSTSISIRRACGRKAKH